MNFTCLGGEKRIKGNNMYGTAIIIIGIIFCSTFIIRKNYSFYSTTDLTPI